MIKTRRMRWAGYVARKGERRGVYRDVAGKTDGKRPLRRPRRGWENNIKMGLQEVGWRRTWTGLIWLNVRRDGRDL